MESLESHVNHILSGPAISQGKTVIDVTRICVNQRNGIICSFPDTVQTALGNNQKGRNGSVLNILSGQSIP